MDAEEMARELRELVTNSYRRGWTRGWIDGLKALRLGFANDDATAFIIDTLIKSEEDRVAARIIEELKS